MGVGSVTHSETNHPLSVRVPISHAEIRESRAYREWRIPEGRYWWGGPWGSGDGVQLAEAPPTCGKGPVPTPEQGTFRSDSTGAVCVFSW